MSSAPLRYAVALLVGIAAGWVGSRRYDSSPIPNAPVSKARSEEPGVVSSAKERTSSVAQVLELGKPGGGLQRDAELFDALKAMKAEDFRMSASLWTHRMQADMQKNPVRARAILDRWFEVDPESARPFAESICRPPPQGRSIEGRLFCLILAESAARSDPEWALDQLLFDGPNPAWYDPNSSIMSGAAGKNPALAKERLQGMEKSPLYPALFIGYITGISRNDPLAAMDLAVAEKGFERVNLIPHCVREAAGKGRGMALEALAKIDDSDLRRSATLEAMKVLARESNTPPLPFLEETIGRDNLAGIDIDSIRGSDAVLADPLGAANWAAGLPEQSRRVFLNGILESWQKIDVKAATEWMQQHSDRSDGTKENSVAAFANDLLASRLFAAGKTAEAMAALASTTDGGMTFQMVVRQIAYDDPEAAAHWSTTMPEGKTREHVANGAAERWMWRDPAAAEKWVEGLPAGTMRDQALIGMIRSGIEFDPEDASRYAPQISDARLRLANIENVFEPWFRRDPEAAREWVRNIPNVDERWKTRFLRRNP